MFNSKILSLFGAFVLLALMRVSSADEVPNYEREQRIMAQIEPDIFDGEAVWLAANGREFLAIYMEADSPKGTVLILHGRDVSPEDLNVAGPLRVGLAENGWSTLALQMPVLEKGKTYYDYLPILQFGHGRIEAGIRYLRELGESTVVLAGHSCGAHMANDWLNNAGESAIDGYVAMGLGATDAGQDLQTPFPMGAMSVPVLDIYGSEEFPRPLAMLDDRRFLLEKNGNVGSRQVAIEGANHYFTDAGEQLTEQVLEWLDNTSF